jgi:hypothetical protein
MKRVSDQDRIRFSEARGIACGVGAKRASGASRGRGGRDPRPPRPRPAGVDGVRKLGLAFGPVDGRVDGRGHDHVGACGAQRRLDRCHLEQIELRPPARNYLGRERRRALHECASHLASGSGHSEAHRHAQVKRSGESARRGWR